MVELAEGGFCGSHSRARNNAREWGAEISDGRGGWRYGLRKRNRPRRRTCAPRVRERLVAVEMPLKRTNQSRNVRQNPFFSAICASSTCLQALDSAPRLRDA